MKDLFPVLPVLQGERLLLRPLEDRDAAGLLSLTRQAAVYRWLPTFLFEKQFDDPRETIRKLYDECLQDSLILGVFSGGSFCGLAEMYGYRQPIRKISVGYRLLEECWGRGFATEALGLMLNCLTNQTDIDIVTASTMIENLASAGVLKKNGFVLVSHSVPEDWGYPRPTLTDKWIL